MPAFPLSPRLLAVPLWGAALGRLRLVERRRPLLRARVSARHPLPPAHVLARIVGAEGVRGLHLVVEEATGGWAEVAAARSAIERIRSAGKLVTMELERCGNLELYLASAADRVWLRPLGEVQALGLAATMRFAGDGLSRLGLRFDMEAAGAYKSFGEAFTRSFASGPNREATADLVAELQAELERGVAEGRRIPLEQVREALAAGPLSAEEARVRGLCDGVAYPDEVRAEVERMHGGDLRTVSLAGWARASGVLDRLEGWIEERVRVVVLHLRGNVVDGEGSQRAPSIAVGPVTRALRALREDDGVGAVVLAVNSPGGSATASDLLWREVELLGRRKPVIAAFGDVAASGGYYLAAPAAEIWALPNTLTGSIGVVGGKLVVGEALERVGVHTEIVSTLPNAAMYGADAAFTPEQRLRFRASLERFYRGFVERVSAGRRQPYDAVEVHARGRVWSGRRAHALGLVDQIGDTEGAVRRAAVMAGVRRPLREDRHVAPRGSRLTRLVRSWIESAAPALRLLPPVTDEVDLLLTRAGRPLLWWPWSLDIR